MERVLLDTDIFSEVLRGRDQSVTRHATEYILKHGWFTLSVITISEMVDGFWRQERKDAISRLLEAVALGRHRVLPIDLNVARLAGLIFGDLHRTGQPIGRSDPFIAAIAIEAGIPLVTGNTRHFERIQMLGYNLVLQDWRVSSE